MACIVKLPSDQCKGVVTFTTQERDRVILNSSSLQRKIQGLKSRWLVGLHHNWHDFKFRYNPLFDFSMAGESDLREVDGKSFELFPMDAANFVPPAFKPRTEDKFWDILYVARAVYFKNIPEFFETIRALYDRGHKYRVLFICPVPPYQRSERRTVFYGIRKVYDKMFSAEEQNLFTLMTIDYRYPFPFDLDSLAYFYRSSKVFVHTAKDERRSRTAAYAWASGLPVVALDPIGSLLPEKLRKAPFFFKSDDFKSFPDAVEKALTSVEGAEFDEVVHFFKEDNVVSRFVSNFKSLYERMGLQFDNSGFLTDDLDMRLGTHHDFGQGGNNKIPMHLDQFIDLISSMSNEELQTLSSCKQAEVFLAKQKTNPKSNQAFSLKKLFKASI